MNDRPRFCQIDDSDTPNSARSGSFSQLTLSTPVCEFNRTKKRTEATATDVATVEEKIVWKIGCPELAVGGDRQERAEHQAGRHREEHVLDAVPEALRNSSPVRTSLYCSQPT